jgi:hypothetical protein
MAVFHGADVINSNLPTYLITQLQIFFSADIVRIFRSHHRTSILTWPQGPPMFWSLKYFRQKNRQKLAFFTQTTANFCKKGIITLVFEKNANFLQKIVIITSTPDLFSNAPFLPKFSRCHITHSCAYASLCTLFLFTRKQGAGLPDFSWHNIPKLGKIYQLTTTLPNDHKIYLMAVKYSKWECNIPTISNLRPSKIYPNRDFWF